jgi:hypothetical protein
MEMVLEIVALAIVAGVVWSVSVHIATIMEGIRERKRRRKP